MKDETTVPDVKNLFKQVMAEPERMFEMLQIDIKRQAERAVTELMKAELSKRQLSAHLRHTGVRRA